MRAIGALTAYLLLKQLSKPWEDWDIYKLGLIDNKGNTTRKSKTPMERKAMNIGVILAKNLKKILQKVPFGKTTIASAIAALYLIKEDQNLTDNEDFDVEISKTLNIINGRITMKSGGFYPFSSEYVSESATEQLLLEAGKYTDERNNLFVVKEDLYPITSLYGLPLYELYDVVNKDRIIISQLELNKV